MWVPKFVLGVFYRILRDVIARPRGAVRGMLYPGVAIRAYRRAHKVEYRRARVRHKVNKADRFFQLVTQRKSSEFESYLDELKGSDFYQTLLENVQKMEMGVKGGRPAPRELHPGHITARGKPDPGVLLYSVVRAMQPLTVVETGVANGVSSAMILKALDMNNRGTLHSIDIFPKRESQSIAASVNIYIPENAETGWLVPTDLEHRWQYIQGDTAEVLPQLLEELEHIDMFLHDSDHTYENVLFEYRAAWKHLNPGGVILTDDVGPGFAYFQRSTGAQGAVYDFLGGALKDCADGKTT